MTWFLRKSKDFKLLRLLQTIACTKNLCNFVKLGRDELRDAPTTRSHQATHYFNPATATAYSAVTIPRIRNFKAVHIADGMWKTNTVARHALATSHRAQDKHGFAHVRDGPHLPTPFLAKQDRSSRQKWWFLSKERRRDTQPKPRIHPQNGRVRQAIALNKKLKIFYLY